MQSLMIEAFTTELLEDIFAQLYVYHVQNINHTLLCYLSLKG